MFPNRAPLEYRFHGILGHEEFSDSRAVWLPDDAISDEVCSDGDENQGEEPGEDYQQLAKDTGGLRFPICDNASFNTIFEALATDTIEGVSLPCTFTPSNESGTVDLSKTELIYTASGGGAQSLPRVADVDGCASGGYYQDGEAFTLCPDTCDIVQADEGGTV